MSASTITVPVFVSKPNIADEDFLPMWDVVGAGMKKLTYLELKTDIFTTDALDTEIFFNNAGIIDGDPRLTYDPGLNRMSVGVALGGVTHTIQLVDEGSIGSVLASNSFTQYGQSNVQHSAQNDHVFLTSTIERLRIADALITSSVDLEITGQLGVGVTPTLGRLHLSATGQPLAFFTTSDADGIVEIHGLSSATLRLDADNASHWDIIGKGNNLEFNHQISGLIYDFGLKTLTLTPSAYVAALGDERTFDITADITGQTGTSTFAGLYMNILDTARASSGITNAIQIQNDTNDVFTVDSAGKVLVPIGGGYFINDIGEGMIAIANNRIGFTIAGSTRWELNPQQNFADAFGSAVIGGALIRGIVSTATQPVFILRNNVSGTGIGGVSGEIDLITNSLSRLNITDTLITSSVDWTFTNVLEIDVSTSAIGFFTVTPVIRQTTTSQTPASFTANSSGISNDSATWNGYTIGDLVAIMQAYGLLT